MPKKSKRPAAAIRAAKKKLVKSNIVRNSAGMASPLGNVVGFLKNSKAISKGLNFFSENTSGPFSLLSSAASSIASSLGFSTPEGNSSGGSVVAAPAPIQFPRIMDYKSGLTSHTQDGHTIIRTMELVAAQLAALPDNPGGFGPAGAVEFAFTTGVSLGSVAAPLQPSMYGNYFQNNPPTTGNLYMFPLLGPTAQQYLQYKLRGLRLHYEHFCPTTVTGSVYLMWSPDCMFGESSYVDPWASATFAGSAFGIPTVASLTESQVANSQYVMQSAVYEDSFLECDLSGIDMNKWMSNAPWQPLAVTGTINTGPISTFVPMFGADPRTNFIGQFGVFFSDIPESATAVPFGKLWVEAIWELNSYQAGFAYDNASTWIGLAQRLAHQARANGSVPTPEVASRISGALRKAEGLLCSKAAPANPCPRRSHRESAAASPEAATTTTDAPRKVFTLADVAAVRESNLAVVDRILASGGGEFKQRPSFDPTPVVESGGAATSVAANIARGASLRAMKKDLLDAQIRYLNTRMRERPSDANLSSFLFRRRQLELELATLADMTDLEIARSVEARMPPILLEEEDVVLVDTAQSSGVRTPGQETLRSAEGQ